MSEPKPMTAMREEELRHWARQPGYFTGCMVDEIWREIDRLREQLRSALKQPPGTPEGMRIQSLRTGHEYDHDARIGQDIKDVWIAQLELIPTESDPVCECKKCTGCKGFSVHDPEPCDLCCNTGIDNGDCALHPNLPRVAR